MFRNEGPINFNTDGQYFVSAAEQVGEKRTAALKARISKVLPER
jgi:hypothetical protein